LSASFLSGVNSNATVTSSSFNDVIAPASFGIIYLFQAPFFGAKNSTFSRSFAEQGAVHVSYGGTASIEGCSFIDNRAAVGGMAPCMLIRDLDTVHVKDSEFRGNNAPESFNGCVYILSTTTYISSSRFFNNSAERVGGAMTLVSLSAHFQNCTFSHNFVGSSGGAVSLVNVNATMDNVVSIGDSSGRYGGFLLMEAGNLSVTDARFEGSSSTVGGAMWLGAGAVSIVDSAFVNVTAEQGGAVYSGSGSKGR
jgi:hypothetical protein